MAKAEYGIRRPVHVGTRLQTAEGGAAICAVPVLAGETVARVAIDAYASTKDDSANVDQPPIFSWIGILAPMQYGSSMSITTAVLDAMVSEAFSLGSGEYVGGEPNPGSNTPIGSARYQRFRQVFKREVIGNPMPVGKDSLDNTDARFIDRFRTVVERPQSIDYDAVLLFGTRIARTDAQTDFGLAEMDSSANPYDIQNAYTNPLTGAQSTQGGKIAEMLYGGDNYIEADSFKEESRRSYLIVRPAIHRSGRMIGRYS